MKDYMCKEEDDQRLLFLEDHYKTSHKGKVIHCIDHHPSVEEVNYRYHITFSCSTSYLIYEYLSSLLAGTTITLISLSYKSCEIIAKPAHK